MKAYVIISVVGFCILILLACVPAAKPICRHWAIFSALTYTDLTNIKTRISVGPSGKLAQVYHAQAEAFINNEWVPLEYFYGKVRIGQRDDFFPMRYFSIAEFMEYSLMLDTNRRIK